MEKVLFGLYLIPMWILFRSYLVWFVFSWALPWFSFVLFGSYFVVFDLIRLYFVLLKSYLVLFGSYLVWFGPYLDLIWSYLDLSLSCLGFNCQKKASMIMHLTKGLTSSIHENDRYRRIHVCEVGSKKDGQWSIVHVEREAQLSEAHLVTLCEWNVRSLEGYVLQCFEQWQ